MEKEGEKRKGEGLFIYARSSIIPHRSPLQKDSKIVTIRASKAEVM